MIKTKIYLSIILLFIYDYLFWSQSLGLNALIFTCIVIPILLASNKLSVVYTNTWISIAVTLLLSIMVFLYNSGTAKVAFCISFAIMVGFIHQPSLRTVYHSILTGLYGLLDVYKNYIEAYKSYKLGNKKLGQLFQYFRISLIPIIIILIFYWIFKMANPIFNDLSTKFWGNFWVYTFDFLLDISFSRIFFLLFGLAICAILLFKNRISTFALKEVHLNDRYRRVKNTDSIKANSFGSFFKSLTNEFRISILTIGLVNILLLIVNIIDINWIWFNFNYSDVSSLSQFVHEGTYLLIFSILISIGIILYFFRGSLNLLEKSKPLKILSYVWIAQNAILAISVAIRNYHYIHQHGLAYKRVGVGLFLLLVLYGLYTLIIKIHSKKSSFFLFRTNSWAIYFVMLLTSLINWDVIIARHNVNHPNQAGIDHLFLINLSDKTLYILKEKESLFKDDGLINDNQTYTQFLNARIRNFIEQHPKEDLQSFTIADNKSYHLLLTYK